MAGLSLDLRAQAPVPTPIPLRSSSGCTPPQGTEGVTPPEPHTLFLTSLPGRSEPTSRAGAGIWAASPEWAPWYVHLQSQGCPRGAGGAHNGAVDRAWLCRTWSPQAIGPEAPCGVRMRGCGERRGSWGRGSRLKSCPVIWHPRTC